MDGRGIPENGHQIGWMFLFRGQTPAFPLSGQRWRSPQVRSLRSTDEAFVGLTASGAVVAWGDPLAGGSAPSAVTFAEAFGRLGWAGFGQVEGGGEQKGAGKGGRFVWGDFVATCF